MLYVEVQIIRWVADDPQPGIVEARLVDAAGNEWSFVDKPALFTAETLDANSIYPRPAVIRCKAVKLWRDSDGREICTVDTSEPDSVEADGGRTTFDVSVNQVSEVS
jgi:hypothetical protein